VVVSRQALIDSSYSTVVCAPIFTERHGLPTQVPIGPPEGMKHDCAIHCDGLISIQKNRLTDYVGKLGTVKLEELDRALMVALAITFVPKPRP
jgi:mRNA interferase MazF